MCEPVHIPSSQWGPCPHLPIWGSSTEKVVHLGMHSLTSEHRSQSWTELEIKNIYSLTITSWWWKIVSTTGKLWCHQGWQLQTSHSTPTDLNWHPLCSLTKQARIFYLCLNFHENSVSLVMSPRYMSLTNLLTLIKYLMLISIKIICSLPWWLLLSG